MARLNYNEFGFELCCKSSFTGKLYYSVKILDRTKFNHYQYILLPKTDWGLYYTFDVDVINIVHIDKLSIIDKNVEILKRKLKLDKIYENRL